MATMPRVSLLEVVELEHDTVNLVGSRCAFPSITVPVQQLGGLEGDSRDAVPRALITLVVFHPHQHVGVVVHIGDGWLFDVVLTNGHLCVVA